MPTTNLSYPDLLVGHADPNGTVQVSHNNITISTPTPDLWGFGIGLLQNEAPAEVAHNEVTVANYGIGIVLIASNRAEVVNNAPITLTSAQARAGISLLYAQGSRVADNEVTGPGTSGNASVGVEVFNSPGNAYCCNVLEALHVGMQVAGGSLSTDLVRGNQFGASQNSLLLPDVNAILGSQTHTQNCWGMGAGPAIYGEGIPVPLNVALQYPFTVDPAINACFMPAAHFPMGWFRNIQDTEYAGSVCALSDCSLDMFAPESDDVKRIAGGDTLVNPTVMWDLQRYTYERLQEETVQNTAILTFLGHADTSSIAAFYTLGRDIKALFAPDSVTIAQLRTKLGLVEVKLDSLLLLDALFPAADSLERLNLKVEQNKLLNALYVLAEESQDLADQWLDFVADEAGKLRSQNDSIGVTALYEVNEKAVNDSYLSWLHAGFTPVDSTQTARLQAIAEQCPLEGGNAVYRARALLAVLTQVYQNYHDSLGCLPTAALTLPVNPQGHTGSYQSQLADGLEIYPNPASNEISIVWGTTDTPGVLVVYDAFGRQLREQILDSGASAHTMYIHDLPEGLYFFRIRFQSWDAIRKIIVNR